MWLYSFAKALVRPLYSILYRIQVEGLENVPKEGGVILCGNHFHVNDPIIVGICVPRKVAFMAKQELFTVPVLRTIIRGLGAFPVKRGHPDRAALRHAMEVLKSGRCFGIFPEGTRNRSGKLAKAEPGTAYFALKTGATVIPVGITGTYKLFSPVRVRFGPPVDLSPYRSAKLTSEVLEAAGELIMAGIGAQLVPPVEGRTGAAKA